jgi:hypothetical protein
MLLEVSASFMFPSQGSNQHGPPLLGRVPVPCGSPASSLLFGPPTSCHPSASAHFPIAFGLPPGACLFFSELRVQTLTARSPELDHRRSAIAGIRHRGDGRISRVTGPSSSYAPWSNTPPNASSSRPVLEMTLLPSGGLLPSAFGIVWHFVAAFPRLTRLHTYASPMPLPTPAQGLLPTRRAQL